MLPKTVRLGLIFIFGVAGVTAIFYDLWLALVLWITTMLLLLGHFKFGTVIGALRALGKGETEKAEHLLLDIKRPEWLAKSYKAYYHFAFGLIAMHREEWETSKERLEEAVSIGLPGKQERAISYLNLAHLAFIDKDKETCEMMLEHSKENATKDLFLKQRIEELEKALATL